MERNTVERVTEWDSEPFSGGHAGLRDLAGREFTGAVTEGSAWLFMLNGRVLGVFDGDLSGFEGADGTAYAAPDRSLPLLFAMQETGGEVRGEYYTEETPLSEVDRTLKSGNFTGYVELSENVLSGDYYLVYYGGRRLPVAFIGNQSRRVTGDEAFERADDEVGIYRVRTVELDISDVPEAEEPEPEPSTAAGAAGAEAADEPAEDDATTREESTQTDVTPTGASTVDTSPTNADESADAAASTDATDTLTDTDASAPEPDESTDDATDSIETTPMTGRSPSTPDETSASRRTDRDSTAEPEEGPDPSTPKQDPEPSTTQPEPSTTQQPQPAREPDAAGASQFEAEADWQGTTTIPALDPAESVAMESETPDPAAEPSPQPTEPGEGTGVPAEEVEALREERDRLRERVAELEDENDRLGGERDRLRERVAELEDENDRLGGERDRLERERDEATATAEELETELAELRATVDELETELEAAEADLAAAEEYVPEGDHEIAPEQAMAGTSLFVRYEREGGPTLTDAHAGDADRESVNGNLRLERHTEFDDDGAVVNGEPFDEWLRNTVEYGFVEWLTGSFVHDIRETRNQTAMGKLFDAVPEIDRVEFRGSVDLGEAADEESADFDVVLRDRMGQPLVVTDFNDSRDPATEPMLESLLRNATPVAESNDRLSAAFFVTSSYYEPGALETAEEATGGGFLSRGKHKSFVRLTRTDGYHLCLVETRDGEFHVSLPEL